MSTKTIKINPALFQVSTKKKSLKKNASLNEQQQTPSSSSQQPSPKLVKRIPKPKINTTKMKFQKNTFTKAEVNVVSNNNVPAIPPTTNANLHLIADVPFGVLKGGSKPTYRQYYNKTLKKNSSSSSSMKWKFVTSKVAAIILTIFNLVCWSTSTFEFFKKKGISSC